MRLPWADAFINGIGPIPTSITQTEIAVLTDLALGEDPPVRVLEIGSAYGYASCSMALAGASVTTIDPHEGYGALSESLVVLQRNMRLLHIEDRLTMIVGKSEHVLPKLADVQSLIFDVVFIDGDHRLPAVTNDLEYAWKLLAHNGVLAVHDYGEETCPDVKVAVDAFTLQHRIERTKLDDTLWRTVRTRP